MRLAQTTFPDPVVSVNTLATHLRLNTNVERAMLSQYLASAQSWFEMAGNLALPITAFSLYLNWYRSDEWRGLDDDPVGFVQRGVTLPRSPLVAVTAFQYLGVDDAWHDYTDYKLGGGKLRKLFVYSAIPATILNPENVRIDFTAGFATTPAMLIDGILLLATHKYLQRSAAGDGKAVEIPFGAQAILDLFANHVA